MIQYETIQITSPLLFGIEINCTKAFTFSPKKSHVSSYRVSHQFGFFPSRFSQNKFVCAKTHCNYDGAFFQCCKHRQQQIKLDKYSQMSPIYSRFTYSLPQSVPHTYHVKQASFGWFLLSKNFLFILILLSRCSRNTSRDR